MALSPDRYRSYPTRLEAEDYVAILDQAIDPEANYSIQGWVLRAMAAELLHQVAAPSRRHPADLPGQGTFLEVT